MLKFFAKCFEGVCSFLSILNFILFGILFAFAGYYVCEEFLYYDSALFALLGGVIGILVAFFNNVIIFGFISQIADIRKSLEDIKNK